MDCEGEECLSLWCNPIGAFLSLFFIRDSLLKFESGAIHLEFMQDDYLDITEKLLKKVPFIQIGISDLLCCAKPFWPKLYDKPFGKVKP